MNLNSTYNFSLNQYNFYFEINWEFNFLYLEKFNQCSQVYIDSDFYIQIRQDYNKIFAEDPHEIISDRKLVKIVKLLKISAYLNGRGKVDFSDLMLLTNCLWNNPENIEKVTRMVLDAVKRNVAKDEE